MLPDVKEATLTIGAQTLKFTNLKKVFYPDEGYTKRNVLNYYDGVSDLILPHLLDRPLSLKRYPNGIKEEFFFQKDTPDSYPSWLRTEFIDSDHTQKPIRYVFAADRASLLYLVNLGCIDHNPWMSRSQSLENPDFVLIDLDPQECPFDMIVDAALMVKRVLDRIGLAGYPKTTGGDGLHVYIPLEPVYTFEEARIFAELISRLVIHEKPRHVHHAAFGLEAAAQPRVFRLPAGDEVEDYRGAVRAAGLPGSAGGHAARMERGETRTPSEPVQHHQCARAVHGEGGFVRGGAEEAPAAGGGA